MGFELSRFSKIIKLLTTVLHTIFQIKIIYIYFNNTCMCVQNLIYLKLKVLFLKLHYIRRYLLSKKEKNYIYKPCTCIVQWMCGMLLQISSFYIY